AACGEDTYREPAEPLAPDFVQVPFGDAGALESAVDEKTACVLVEPILGEGGVYVPPDGYLAAVRRACDRAGALLIADEIQTGLGRTGRMFRVEHEGVVPDIMTLAKSLGGGIYPIAAALYRPELAAVLAERPFVHLSAFAGSDLGCVVALETIRVVEEERLAENAAAMGERFEAGFRRLHARFPQLIEEHRGRGLMLALEFTA